MHRTYASRRLLEWLPAAIGAGLAGPRSARRPIPASRLLARMAQKHEKHAQRLDPDPGYRGRIIENKNKENNLWEDLLGQIPKLLKTDTKLDSGGASLAFQIPRFGCTRASACAVSPIQLRSHYERPVKVASWPLQRFDFAKTTHAAGAVLSFSSEKRRPGFFARPGPVIISYRNCQLQRCEQI